MRKTGELLLRSAQQPDEQLLQQKLGLKTLPNIMPTRAKSQYI